MLVVLVGTLGIMNMAYAQEELRLVDEQTLKIILVGTLGGLLMAYQGYRTSKEEWDTLKFFDGVLHTVIVSVPIALGAALTQTDLSLYGLVLVFFASIGAGSQLMEARTKTIPSNTP